MKLPRLVFTKEKENEMLLLLRKGSKYAFEEIFKIYWKELYRHAFSKLRDKQEAEEIVQDIMATLWIKREELLITNLEYYLHTSVKNKVLNRIRSGLIHKRYWDFYKIFLPDNRELAQETVYYDDLKEALEKSSDSLSDKAKTIFRLNRLEGYSISDIAQKLKLSEKAVEYHITRSVKVLKVKLKDYLVPALIIYFSTPV